MSAVFESLFDYQVDAIAGARSAINTGKRAPLVVIPTGGGKTRVGVATVMSHLERSTVHRTVWLAHRIELVKQAANDLMREGLTDLRIESGDGSVGTVGARVTVGTVQTLLARGYDLSAITLAVYDEAHHYVSAEWKQIRDSMPNALRLGLTATPERSDRTGLGTDGFFDEMISPIQYRELIARGRLTPIEVFAPARVVKELAWDPIEAWQRHARGRCGVVFASSVEHARALADRFNDVGLRAACIDGKQAQKTRERDLDAFQAGRLDVLTNVHVLTEGWDAPRAEVCMLARGCANDGTYLQMVGRVMRACPGKTLATLIDLRGVVHQHGMPDEPRVYSLQGKKGVARAFLAPLRSCPMCACCFVSEPQCPRCGFDDFPKPKPPTVRKQALRAVTVDDVVTRSVKREYFDKLVEEARRGGYKPAYVGVRFKQRFGHWPQWIIPVTKKKEVVAA